MSEQPKKKERKPPLWRCLTCPICETVVRVRMRRRNLSTGRESYTLPPHRPTLDVNMCSAFEVRVEIGGPNGLTKSDLAKAPPSIPPECDARKVRYPNWIQPLPWETKP